MTAKPAIFHSKELNQSFLSKLKQELQKEFAGCKKIAIKIHFGEPGQKLAFKPEDIEPITTLLKSAGIEFFLYDSPVVYKSIRNNPETYKKYAEEKGWAKLGQVETNDDFIEEKGKALTYRVCRPLTDADGVLIISHFKGHVCSGFGGAIKNLGMGALTKKSKGEIHSGGEPNYVGGCIQCRVCEEACPIGVAKVDEEKQRPFFHGCYGCSNCIYACPNNCLMPKTDFFDFLLAEGAFSAQKNFKKFYYISFLKNITKLCDCSRETNNKIIAKDQGILCGKDAVAIDKAGLDIVIKSEGKNVFLEKNKKTGTRHIEEAAKLGMGQAEYRLIEL